MKKNVVRKFNNLTFKAIDESNDGKISFVEFLIWNSQVKNMTMKMKKLRLASKLNSRLDYLTKMEIRKSIESFRL